MEQFSRGYFVTTKPVVDNEYLRSWEQTKVGAYFFSFQRKVDWSISSNEIDDKAIVLIGAPIDIMENDILISSIADRLMSRWHLSGEEEVIKSIAYLGGRFIAFLVSPESIKAIPDCHATLACYWAAEEGRFIASSHSRLTAEIGNFDVDEKAVNIVSSELYNDAGGRYYPGLLTPYKKVKPLIANCLVEYSALKSIAKHERFYPWQPVNIKANTDSLFKQFSVELENHIRLMTEFGPTNISLTAGMDSRVVLKAARRYLANNSYTYTYFRFENPVKATIEDLMGASTVARTYNIGHRIIRLDSYDQSSPWVKKYVKSFPKGARFPALANCYAENFTENEISLIGTISETGTAFYAERDVTEISAARLAKKFTYTKINSTEELIEIFEKYIDYTAFTKDKLFDLDYHDLFYWEHRNSKWANIWYSELDLSHKVLLPFNSRRLIELMLSIPIDSRKNKYLLTRYLNE